MARRRRVKRILNCDPSRLQDQDWSIAHAMTITPQNVQRLKAIGGGLALQPRHRRRVLLRDAIRWRRKRAAPDRIES